MRISSEENLQKLFEPYKGWTARGDPVSFGLGWILSTGAKDKVLESTKKWPKAWQNGLLRTGKIHNERGTRWLHLLCCRFSRGYAVWYVELVRWNRNGPWTCHRIWPWTPTVNILRNREEDAERGVNFYPDGWGFDEMLAHTERNLALADAYIRRDWNEGHHPILARYLWNWQKLHWKP